MTDPTDNEAPAQPTDAPAPPARRRSASRPAGPPAPVDDDAGAAVDDQGVVDTVGTALPLPDAEPEVAAPVKKAARKRAPRKSAAAVGALPEEGPSDGAAADPAAVRPVRKRASRKRATAPEPVMVALPLVDVPMTGTPSPDSVSEPQPVLVPDPEVWLEPEVAPDSELSPDPGVLPAPGEQLPPGPADAVTSSSAPALAVPVLFQAPDPAAAPPRRHRRASAPAGPPVPHDVEPSPQAHEAPADDVVPVDDDPPSTDVLSTDVLSTDVLGADADVLDPADAEELDADPADDGAGGGRKRRRRGGRGRRPRGEDDDARADAAPQQQPGTPTGTNDEPAIDTASPHLESAGDQAGDGEGDSDGPDADTDDEAGSASSRRRRRRRRRPGGGSGADAAEGSDDPPGTVTKVRAPRRTEDEVTSVRGSTRLEAKKQRRRDGREAGRQKPTITESEFLARRESVQRTMVVRESAGRTQIAVLEDGVLVEHYVANETNTSMIGNVYLGRVQNVLPSMEAAFVDIGKGRNAVLYAGEVNWDAAGLDGQPRRIEAALKSGDTVLVQVTKDPMGHKGARLTSQVSLPGRYLVYVPNSSMTGISRKLPDTERSRLKRILKAVVPEKAGVIVRTAAEGASEDELTQDVGRLTAQWSEIEQKAGSSSGGPAPKLLYGEPDLTIRVVRDVFNEDFTSLVVSGEGAWGVVQPYLEHVAPDLAGRVSRWESTRDVFAEHRIDEQLLKAMDRKVWLPSGGSLVIDRTEAMTVVDVNTGKFTGAGGNLEETVTRNNLEAAEEVVRQLRLRDIGGIIVVDFIDMVLEVNRDLVLRRLLECLGRDRTKHQVAEVTSLGLVQMTRKRVGQGLLEVFSEPCEHCQGRGVMISAEPVERHPGSNGSGSPSGSGGGSGQGAAGSSRRGRGGRGAGDSPVATLDPPPVRQTIPAGFVASLAQHHDEPAQPRPLVQPAEESTAEQQTAQQPSEPVISMSSDLVLSDLAELAQSVEQHGVPHDDATAGVDDATAGRGIETNDGYGIDVEPAVESARPARRRRRASSPTGPPVVHD